jgi:mannose-6-phosphate isomerase-like protein (cupin superfamily)
VIEGRIRVNYEDGTEEFVGAGEVYYWPAGHTIVVEEAVRMVEFSPHDQMSQVLAHVVGKL